ncbi:MAG: hypothetical protein J3K34DRAFT_519653 [Monoraphidium minutum]|nr:MAG: hypothetical protein J3K34DRAFT_519653 [Monoraphidium minutum]
MRAACTPSSMHRVAATRAPARAPAPLAPRPRPRGPAAPRAVSPAVAAIEQQIAQKEAQLAAMFDRRPPPKAAEVAEIRKEINALQASLPGQGQAAPAAAAAAPGAPAGAGAPRSKKVDAELAARVMAELEAAMSGPGVGAAEDREVALLEAANTALRANAHALLAHQARLEEMLAAAKAGGGAARRA